jgi:glutaredoxin 3
MIMIYVGESVAKIEIYTTTYCPFCDRAKALLKRKGASYQEIDVTTDTDLRIAMMERAGGRKSVPEIFVDGELVGGFEELKALDDAGKLDPMLGSATA